MRGFRPRPSSLYLPRPRLSGRLPDSAGHVVWLEAPFGYGKSVLAAQWADLLEAAGWRVFWASAEGRPDLRSALASALGIAPETPLSALTEALWAVPTLLVIEEADSARDLDLVLSRMEGLVLLASRGPLPVAELPRLTTQGRLVHLTSGDLAFNLAEAVALFGDAALGERTWQRTAGWPLPTHFAALTGEQPEPAALLAGVRASLGLRTWLEALLLAGVPYLPTAAARGASARLAKAGFAQEVESGYRLHPWLAEALLASHGARCARAVLGAARRLPVAVLAEALRRTHQTAELSRVLESHADLAAAEPTDYLRWDAACATPPGPVRLLNRAWAQSVTGDLGAARRSYEQVAGSPAASAGQRLQALGWWVFDLPLDQVERYRRLLAQAEGCLAAASSDERGDFLFNASAFPLGNRSWHEVEDLLHRAIAELGPDGSASIRLSAELRLAQVGWELRGDLTGLLLALEARLRSQPQGSYNAAVSHALLGRYLALLGRAGAEAHLEEAARSQTNRAVALIAAAEAACLRGDTAEFPRLAGAFEPWAAVDPGSADRLNALWARALRRAGRPEAALEIAANRTGPESRSELALALEASGRHAEAVAALPPAFEGEPRLARLGRLAAQYQVTRRPADLSALLDGTQLGAEALASLVPLGALPRSRPELSYSYDLSVVLRSGWREAVVARLGEIPPLDVRLLGTHTTTVLGEAVPLKGRHKAILTLMALRLDRSRIGAVLWPDVSRRSVLNNLHVQLNQLRKALEPWGVKTYLHEEGLQNARVDLWELRSALTAGDAERVLELYREPFAPGVDLEPVEELRYTLRREVATLLLESAGRRADPLPFLERVLELEPLEEAAWQRLLAELVRRGRRGEALERYRRFAARLEAELEVAPLPETSGIVEAFRP